MDAAKWRVTFTDDQRASSYDVEASDPSEAVSKALDAHFKANPALINLTSFALRVQAVQHPAP